MELVKLSRSKLFWRWKWIDFGTLGTSPFESLEYWRVLEQRLSKHRVPPIDGCFARTELQQRGLEFIC